jgi:gluconolactonase
MDVIALGNLWVAALMHGGISIVSPGRGITSHGPRPDRFTTNICYGRPGHCSAFVTLSASGRLIAIDDWPVSGLKLHCEA